LTRPVICAAVLIASTLIAAPSALASGHGPLFGGATPVLGKGGWSFDAAWMPRSSEDAFAQALRTMISFGVTETPRVRSVVVRP
jgi:hypothetical protein